MNSTLTSGPERVALFAVDWGTSSCRVWSLDGAGHVLDTVRSGNGTLSLAQSVPGDDAAARARAFEAELERLAGDALAANPDTPVLACGMVGSSIGWAEAGYIDLPTGIDIRRDSLTHTTTATGRDVWIVPGLRVNAGVVGSSPAGAGVGADEGGAGASEDAIVTPAGATYPDVIRGEETQLLGVLSQLPPVEDGTRTVILPGTHTKWVRVSGDTIEGFTTVMTGEFFSLVMDHSILGEPARTGGAFDQDDFLRGIELGARSDAGSLMAKVFSARGLGLVGSLAPEGVGSYLSGILIGDEVARELPLYASTAPVVICGGATLTRQYSLALDHTHTPNLGVGEGATVLGLLAIARSSDLLATGPEEPAAGAHTSDAHASGAHASDVHASDVDTSHPHTTAPAGEGSALVDGTPATSATATTQGAHA